MHDRRHVCQIQLGDGHISRQSVLIDVSDSIVRVGNIVLYKNPIALAAKHLNPAIGADAGTVFRAPAALAVRRRVYRIGLVGGEGYKGGRERSDGNRRGVGGVNHSGFIRQGGTEHHHQRKQGS